MPCNLKFLLIVRFGFFLWPSLSFALPTFMEVRAQFNPSDVRILDRHGELLQRVRVDKTVWRDDWVRLDEVSPAFRTALIVSEDRRFYQHSGVDWRAVGAAAWGNLFNSRTRGASTLTMQLAGLLDADLKQQSGRNLSQKLVQTVSASYLERRWRKDQILEAYLNLVPFRGELAGISALAQRLFNKYPSGLNEEEAAIAAALIRAPNAPAVQVAQRACGVLKDMNPAALPDCRQLPDTVRFMLTAPNRKSAQMGIAPHFARKVLTGSAVGPSVRTTLDGDLQRFATETLNHHLREILRRNVEDAALIVIDNPTGNVLAWVGSSGVLSAASEVDGVQALRQAGSTLKPFLYAQAIAEKRLTAASLLDDSPASLPAGGGLYMPQNYDKHYKGWVSLRAALAASLNIPAVRTLVQVTPDRFQKSLVALGLPLTQSGDYYGYSLALGSADVTLASLSNAYRVLANGGRVSALRLRESDPQPIWRGVLNPEAAFIVGDILSDRHARVLTFGLDSPLTTRYWSAVKTGTSKDMRDNWCVGFSSRYTVGVWVGNASGAPMWDVSGITGAAPIWHAVMDRLHRSQPSAVPTPPLGLVQKAVRFADGVEAARSEWFIQGTEQTHIAVAHGRNAPRILQPVAGTMLALDPDIPPKNQKTWFESSSAHTFWQLDGKRLGQGARLAWLPWPGPHTLELLDSAGKVLDTVHFEVRGAGVKPVRPR